MATLIQTKFSKMNETKKQYKTQMDGSLEKLYSDDDVASSPRRSDTDNEEFSLPM